MPKARVACHVAGGFTEARKILASLDMDLRPVSTSKEAASVSFDYLLLLGGPDVAPVWYGQTKTHAVGIDAGRDLTEWTLARRALAESIPTLGICRGHQMLAVAAGGTLYQDIHKVAGKRPHPGSHRLTFVHSKLEPILPKVKLKVTLPDGTTDGFDEQVRVNSRHHQAVKHVPFGFITTATAGGMNESIWRTGYLGVQWHPEDLVLLDDRWMALFEWFRDGLT
jgi:gamma-glutamyl-gamma-aminobutyrate hydrolase PuuD